MNMIIPELALVVLVGASASGKSTFAKKHFRSTEIISSDFCRGLVADDENDQAATNPAFEVLHYIANKRLELGKLTVVDATNVQESSRRSLLDLAKKNHCLPVAIVFKTPEKLCQERNKLRTDRQVPEHAIKNHVRALRSTIKNLKREGFRYIYIFNSPEESDDVVIQRQILWNNRKNEHGPFDIIGDVHGCYDELELLIKELGYDKQKNADGHWKVSHPESRRLVFLGDLVDRGPKVPEVLKLVMDMVNSGIALCVPGNHDMKLYKKLNGNNVQITHGLDKSLEQLETEPAEFLEQVKEFLHGLVSHYILDEGKLVVAHAGMKEAYQGRGSGKVRDFALYGETTGESDEYGLPVRYDWSVDYRGKGLVVYGHTPQAEPYSYNNTINIDTGCVFGGKLTAYKYPEGEAISVKALETYYESLKPFLIETTSAIDARDDDDIPDITDVLGKKIIGTRLIKDISIREENAMAALEVMSRFAADPRWLIYIPPTMSPCETSKIDDILEHPLEAFAYYRKSGVEKVVCEQKHMGSRAIVIVCSDANAAKEHFGVDDGSIGICYTRTGRRFFDDLKLEAEFLDTILNALKQSQFFDDFNTEWVCFDCELMPWSAKAQELIKKQYAPVGISGRVALDYAVKALTKASQNHVTNFEVSKQTSGQNVDINRLLERYTQRKEVLFKYTHAYREYCWTVKNLGDLKLAPFHLLATEGAVHVDKDHIWHMDKIKKYCAGNNDLMIATKHMVVDLADQESSLSGVQWWEELTASGGEGMVVKPYDFIVNDDKKLLQPAIKCRGYEYLRIIYGPEYTLPENILRLKARSLGRKRSLALREFSLGIESLERFVKKEPFYRVHECSFGVLALESEPVDPRL